MADPETCRTMNDFQIVITLVVAIFSAFVGIVLINYRMFVSAEGRLQKSIDQSIDRVLSKVDQLVDNVANLRTDLRVEVAEVKTDVEWLKKGEAKGSRPTAEEILSMLTQRNPDEKLN